MIDPTTGQPFSSTQKRLFVFTRMLQSAIPQALSWTGHAGPSSPSSNVPIEDRKDTAGTVYLSSLHFCNHTIKYVIITFSSHKLKPMLAYCLKTKYSHAGLEKL